MPRRGQKRSTLSATALLFILGLAVISVCIALRPIATIAASIVVGVLSVSIAFWRSRRRGLRVKTLGELLTLTPLQFEVMVGSLLRELGFRQVRQVGGAGDLAADLWCRDRDGRSVVVQCKRYAPGHRVGSRDIQAFIGMVSVHHQADKGIFVTTSEFTEPALKLARQHQVELFDGRRLAELVAKNRQRASTGRQDSR